MAKSLRNSALHAFKWSICAEVASKSIGPLVFLLLARILLPTDFGVVAAATVVISFSQIFWDAGLSKALIQRQEHIEEAATAVLWLNFALGVIMFIILFLSADVIASFFHDPRITPVVRVLSIQLPLSALASVHTALFQKSLDFKKLFWIRLVTTSAPALASVPLALMGAGYWALIAGTLTGQVFQTITLWIISAWRPKLEFNWKLAKELFVFGRWAMLSALLGWFYAWMDAIVVGHFLGSHDMGLYRTGNTFVIMVFGLFFSPLLPVLYSVLSRAQNDLPQMRESFIFVARGIAMVSLPIAFGIYTLRVPLAELVFGPQWTGESMVLGYMALSHGIAWLVGANGEVYRASGKPSLETWPMLIMLSIYLLGYLIAVNYGFEIFLSVRMLLSLVALPVHIWISWKWLEINPTVWIRIIGLALLASVSMSWVLGASVPGISNVFVLIAIGAITYGVAIFVVEKRYLLNFFRMARGDH